MIRAGIIGYGVGGSAFHAPLIAAVPGLSLAAIATSRREAVEAAHPGVAVTDAAALIADPSIDLVVVSSPNQTHFEWASAALHAGKHVVVDKPLTSTAAEAEALIALAAERARLLIPFLNRRWDSDFLTVRRLIDEDVLGEVTLFEACWDRFRPELSQAWKEAPGGGQLVDLGPHMIDQVLVLFGMPEAISADLAVQRPGASQDDYFDLTFHYGVRRVRLASSRLVAAPRPRFALHGRKGSFVKFGLDPQEAALRAGASADAPGLGVEDAVIHGTLTGPGHSPRSIASETGDYRRFYQGVVAAIGGTAPAPVLAEDALRGLRLIEMARRSAAQGVLLPV